MSGVCPSRNRVLKASCPPPHRNAIKPALGIRVSLMLLMTVSMLPLLLYVGWMMARGFENDRAHARRITQDVAELTAARLDDHLGNLNTALLTISHAASLHMDDPAQMVQLLRSLRPELSVEIASISLWRRDGSFLASLDPELGRRLPSVANRTAFVEAMRAGKASLEAPIRSRVDGKPIAILGLPVREGDRIAGAVSVTTNLENLQAMVATHRRLPAGAVVTLVDLQGTVLARSLDPQQWIGRQMLPDRAHLRQLYDTGQGSTDGLKNFDGHVRMMGFAAIRGAPWIVFVGVPVDAALAPAWQGLRHSIVLMVPVLGLALSLAVWWARRLTGPLQRLSLTAEAVGQGHPAPIATAEGPRELRSLAHTLDRMSDDLQRHTEALRQSERLLREITDHLPVLISLLDTEERIRFANGTYQEWFGLPPEKVVGQTLRTLYGETVYATLQPYLARALGGERVVYERTMQTPAGERQVQVTLVPQYGSGSVRGLYAMVLDVTAQRRAQARLALSEERLNLAIEGSDQALFDWHIARNTLYQSAQASVLRGGPAVDVTMAPSIPLEWMHPDDAPGLRTAIVGTLKGDLPALRSEYRVRTLNGQWRWVLSRGRVVERDAAGRGLRLAGTHVDVTARHELEDRLRQLAEFDALTGLPNRRLFLDRLDGALARARRHHRAMALMFFDVDRFKEVNDTYGHEAGDQVLCAVAQRLQAGLRASDTVARLAGDEFTVIMEDFDDTAAVEAAAHGLVDHVRHVAGFGAGRSWPVSTSVGVVIVAEPDLDDPQTTGDRVLRAADAALYHAKRAGRDRCCVIDCATTPLEPTALSVAG